MLDVIDRYKFGIIIAFAAYIGFFMYLQMETYARYTPIENFSEETVEVVDEEKLEITQQNLEIQQNVPSDVKSISRDMNDTRQRTMEDWKQDKAMNQRSDESVKDYEKRLWSETKGYEERKKISQEMENRKNKNNTKTSSSSKNNDGSTSGGDKAYAGNVMVDWSLKGRSPHQGNNWYVRNPGYTCGYGASGRVSVKITVNQNGDVTSAVATGSGGANDCMVSQAIKYAKMSRFNYSASSAKSQEGTIIYTFVAQ
jgi:hypothetical protein